MALNLKYWAMVWQVVTILVVWFSFGGISQAESKPLFVEAVDYSTIETVGDCEETLYQGKARKYSRCANPEKLFEAAKNFAEKKRMPLVILWGFDSCPGCKYFEQKYFDPGMLPSNKAVTASLTPKQKAQFSKYSNGANQIALVRMNSGTSIKHNQDFANKIGANKLASTLGWKKVWSPMLMVVNPETNALASNAFFNGREYCTFGEELAEGLAQVGIVKDDPNWKKSCYMPRDYSDEDLISWKNKCESGSISKCFWVGSANEQKYHKLKKTDSKNAENLRVLSEKIQRKACSNGHVNACSSVGYLLKRVKKEYSAEAITFFSKACKQSDIYACGQLGLAHQFGEGGLRKNSAKAVMHYARACDSHDPFACSQLGEMAFYGDLGTAAYQSQTKELIAFGCRDGQDWACDEKYK